MAHLATRLVTESGQWDVAGVMHALNFALKTLQQHDGLSSSAESRRGLRALREGQRGMMEGVFFPESPLKISYVEKEDMRTQILERNRLTVRSPKFRGS